MADDDKRAAAPAGKSEPTAPSAAERVTAEIERWFVNNFHISLIQRDTAVGNHVRAAVDKLKARLAAVLSEL